MSDVDTGAQEEYSSTSQPSQPSQAAGPGSDSSQASIPEQDGSVLVPEFPTYSQPQAEPQAQAMEHLVTEASGLHLESPCTSFVSEPTSLSFSPHSDQGAESEYHPGLGAMSCGPGSLEEDSGEGMMQLISDE